MPYIKFLFLCFVVSLVWYCQKYDEGYQNFPETNLSLTFDLQEDNQLETDSTVEFSNSDHTAKEILDRDGHLKMTGWTQGYKLFANRDKISPYILGQPLLSQMRYKSIDHLQLDLGDYTLTLRGMMSGWGQIKFGKMRLELFNWINREHQIHDTYVFPWDTYVFDDDVPRFMIYHYGFMGLDIATWRQSAQDKGQGKQGNPESGNTWVLKGENNYVRHLRITSDKLKINARLVITEPEGFGHVDNVTEDKKFWLKRYQTMNGRYMSGRIVIDDKKFNYDDQPADGEEHDTNSTWQIKAMLPYKSYSYVRAVMHPAWVDGESFSFTYAAEASAHSESNDITQYLAIDELKLKIHPIEHNIKSTTEPITEPVEFITKDIDMYNGRTVDLLFEPFKDYSEINENWGIGWNKGYKVHGFWSGWVSDHSHRYQVQYARGYIEYGVQKW